MTTTLDLFFSASNDFPLCLRSKCNDFSESIIKLSQLYDSLIQTGVDIPVDITSDAALLAYKHYAETGKVGHGVQMRMFLKALTRAGKELSTDALFDMFFYVPTLEFRSGLHHDSMKIMQNTIEEIRSTYPAPSRIAYVLFQIKDLLKTVSTLEVRLPTLTDPDAIQFGQRLRSFQTENPVAAATLIEILRVALRV